MFAKILRQLEKGIKHLRIMSICSKSKNRIQSKSWMAISPKAQLRSYGGRIEIGSNVGISEGSYLSAVDNGKIVIEDGVFLNRGFQAVSRGSIVIGAGTSVGPNVTIYDHDHLFGSKHIDNPGYKVGQVSIGSNCWIGSGVIILRGTRIGDGCVIGAGTVVKADIPDNMLVTSGRSIDTRPIL